jgi:hypothetical protein
MQYSYKQLGLTHPAIAHMHPALQLVRCERTVGIGTLMKGLLVALCYLSI